MSRLPTPDRGQPIDVPYLYQIITAINEISDQVDRSTNKYTTINTREVLKQDLRTSDTKFYASFQDLYSDVEVKSGDTKDFSFKIDGFKYPPVATVTPINTGTSTASNDVLAVITSITNASIDGFVRFNSSGKVSVSVNVIAIGIPG
jgi:uncharacterized alkaline shock family protein YloU